MALPSHSKDAGSIDCRTAGRPAARRVATSRSSLRCAIGLVVLLAQAGQAHGATQQGGQAASVAPPAGQADGAPQQADPRLDWVVAPGFRLDIHTTGFSFPTAMAFVPRPGSAPDDPLYYVTELRGSVKVVTNDGSVLTFADDITDFRPPRELPDDMGENGAAGLCLDPENGYVFVSFVYRDSANILRNNIVRYRTPPRVFSTRWEDRFAFTDLFARDRSHLSHQIGPCKVHGGQLYVAVGNASQFNTARDLDLTLGKILRMTLDGEPLPSNPHYESGSASRDYVWASGLRNVFGLEFVGDRLFATENGGGIDRFFELREGEDYLYEGEDWTIGMNAAAVFAPAVSPTNIEYLSEGADFFPPEYRGRFYAALAGSPGTEGPPPSGASSIVSLDFDLDAGRMRGVPSHFVRYRGSRHGSIVTLAFGRDGLYFAPLVPPSAGGTTPVFRVSYAPEAEHLHVLGRSYDAPTLIREKGCYGCHRIAGVGGGVGPPIDQPGLTERLMSRLNSEEYEALARRLLASEDDEIAGAAGEVLDASGLDRVETWIEHKVRDPDFDLPQSGMPNRGLTETEASVLAEYLMGLRPAEANPAPEAGVLGRFRNLVAGWLPRPRWYYVGAAFVAGFLIPLVYRSLRGRMRPS